MSDEQIELNKLDRSRARKGGGPLTPEQRKSKQEKFLKAYRETANIRFSCEKVGVSRKTFYDWRDNDEAFSSQLPDADKDADDTLEYAAYERAVNGVPSHVVSQGKIVYEEIFVLDVSGEPALDEKGNPITKRGKPLIERKYSDGLLTTLLKARMPQKYKDKAQLEHTGKDGGPIEGKFNVHVFYPDDQEQKG